MPHLELPRTLEHYFAHAELAPDRDGRRFSITLPYYDAERLDQMQWWWRISHAQLQIIGDAGVAAERARAVARFVRHIERWLANNRRRLTGAGPIPEIGTDEGDGAAERAGPADAEPAAPASRVVNG